jgi:HK97 family phage major capsid protein
MDITAITKQIEDIGAQFERVKGLPDSVAAQDKLVAELREQVDALRKAQLTRSTTPSRPGEVSRECAGHLGAIAILGAARQGRIEKGLEGDRLVGRAAEIIGINQKAALTTSDIPLPVDYGAQVVELVSDYGFARRFGTVFPLGRGSVKLPKLTTDSTFGLISMSATVTEKSPQTAWVTFDAAKWGGLVRLPREIDEDSIFDIGQFLARYTARNIARIEDTVYFAADGTGTYNSLSGLQFSTISNSKVVQMAGTKTKYSDATLANLRAIRSTVDAPVIGRGAYYMHPSFEQHLSGLNASGDKPYIANGIQGASLDGFPIRWVDVMPAYSTSANVSKVFALFGDLSYQYLGVRGGIAFDTSADVFFATDELAVRAVERFTIGLMATGAVSGLETAAS